MLIQLVGAIVWGASAGDGASGGLFLLSLGGLFTFVGLVGFGVRIGMRDHLAERAGARRSSSPMPTSI